MFSLRYHHGLKMLFKYNPADIQMKINEKILTKYSLENGILYLCWVFNHVFN